jgi:hypothetical protein
VRFFSLVLALDYDNFIFGIVTTRVTLSCEVWGTHPNLTSLSRRKTYSTISPSGP